MSDIHEVFTIGSIVSCKTVFQEEIRGEVLAFEPSIHTIILSEFIFTSHP